MSIFRSLRVAALAAGAAAVFAGDVVVDTIADTNLISSTAEAQGRGGRGGRGGGMSGMREIRELLEPDFSRRDMPLFVEQLNLGDGQRAIVEALLDDYDDSFGTRPLDDAVVHGRWRDGRYAGTHGRSHAGHPGRTR